MGGVVVRAPAKVNLHLGVHEGRDARGYHRADSLMVAVSLYDEVSVEDASALTVACGQDVGCDVERNSCWRAALAFADALGREPRVAVWVEKAIPWQSGLGGASSDAAATILGMARLWGVDEDDLRLRAAAASVGADVPFFLDPVPTLLGGVGDEPLERFPHASRLSLVLARPEGPGVSTPAAYAAFDRDPQPLPDPGPLCGLLGDGGTAAGVAARLANNLAPAALGLHPGAAACLRWLAGQEGVLGAQLTGSGSASFAVCRGAAAARAVAECARSRGIWAAAVETLG